MTAILEQQEPGTVGLDPHLMLTSIHVHVEMPAGFFDSKLLDLYVAGLVLLSSHAGRCFPTPRLAA